MVETLTALRRAGVAAAVATLLAGGTAFAGGCPTSKQVAGDAGQAMSDAKAAGVTDMVIASTDLSKEAVNVPDRLFRLRRLVVQPGGVVPWHSHGDRPAIIYIVSGQIVEYVSTCAVPIVHKAGEATTETHATAHWWKNLGKQPAVLLSADLFHVKSEHDEHMM